VIWTTAPVISFSAAKTAVIDTCIERNATASIRRCPGSALGLTLLHAATLSSSQAPSNPEPGGVALVQRGCRQTNVRGAGHRSAAS
jgi:hypothetical protein